MLERGGEEYFSTGLILLAAVLHFWLSLSVGPVAWKAPTFPMLIWFFSKRLLIVTCKKQGVMVDKMMWLFFSSPAFIKEHSVNLFGILQPFIVWVSPPPTGYEGSGKNVWVLGECSTFICWWVWAEIPMSYNPCLSGSPTICHASLLTHFALLHFTLARFQWTGEQ